MKILIATDLYWPIINGAATFSRNLAHGLTEHGHEVLLIAPSPTGNPFTEVHDGITVVRTASTPFPLISGFRVSILPFAAVHQIVADFQPDVIHVQTASLMIGRGAVQAGTRTRIPVVSTNHGMTENLLDNIWFLKPASKFLGLWLKVYVTRINRQASYVTMPTRSAIDFFADVLQKFPLPVEPVSNGIDLAHFKPKPVPASLYRRYHIPLDKDILLYVGRMDKEKHLPILVQAFARVYSKRPGTHLVLVGFGNDANRLVSLVKHLKLQDHVTFTGRVSDEDLPMLYRIGTAYCMPSPAELQCIAMLEAMASGVPVVAVDAGALKELCQNGRNGYLCKLDDPADMAKNILRLLSKDQAARKRLSAESLAIARTHNLNYTIDRFEDIYSQIIAAPKASAAPPPRSETE